MMDPVIQSPIISLFLNRISQTFYQINWPLVRRNHLLRSLIRPCWEKIQRLFQRSWGLSRIRAKLEFDIIPFIHLCNPLLYPSPMHYGNPEMQASRHGHVFIRACAWVYAHTCLFACVTETNGHLQLQIYGVEHYCVLHHSLASVLCYRFVQ